jgi:hypothetical protein
MRQLDLRRTMKRAGTVLAAIAVAAIATVGVVRVAGDSDPAARPNTSRDRVGDDVSRDFDRQQLKEQAALQAKEMKKAEDELARATKDYAKKHAHDGR